MRFYKLLLFFALVLSYTNMNAQIHYPMAKTNISTTPRGMVQGIRPAAKELPESLYLEDTWKPGVVYFFSGQGFEATIRLDLLNNKIEVKEDSVIRVFNTSLIKSFEVLGNDFTSRSFFVNKTFLKDNADLAKGIGFFKVENEGEINLLTGYTVQRHAPDYIEALGVGNKDPSYSKKESLFISIGRFLRSWKRGKEMISKK